MTNGDTCTTYIDRGLQYSLIILMKVTTLTRQIAIARHCQHGSHSTMHDSHSCTSSVQIPRATSWVSLRHSQNSRRRCDTGQMPRASQSFRSRAEFSEHHASLETVPELHQQYYILPYRRMHLAFCKIEFLLRPYLASFSVQRNTDMEVNTVLAGVYSM